MTRMFSLKAALAAGVCLLPLQAALAQINTAPPPDENSVTVGAQYDSATSDYLGRYTGAVHEGLYGLGSLQYGQHDAWDSGGTNYWQMQGNNLGLWDRSFSAKVGQQGTWGLNFSYDGIPYYATNSFKSVWQPNGASAVAPGSLGETFVQLVPKNGVVLPLWLPVATNSPANSLLNYDVGTRRDRFGANGQYEWGDWTLVAGLQHEHKSGTRANSLEIGGAPAITSSSATQPTTFTSGLAYFAQPVDYDTDTYNVTARYNTKQVQAQLGYSFSSFTDNIASFNAQNPFAFTPTTSFGGSPANVSAIYVLPPSNLAHQIKGQFAYNITPTTRLNVNGSYGLQMQNASYVTGVGDTNVAPQTLPRSSFDGLMQMGFGNVALTAQPLPKLNVRLAYTIDDRDNQSPQNVYNVEARSAGGTTPDGLAYTNLPFSYDNQTASAEAGYEVWPQTKVTLNDTIADTHRTFADTSDVFSNRITAKIRGPVFDNVYGSLSAAHEDRWAHNYNSQGWWKAICANPAANDCATEPAGLAIFFEASRIHDEVKSSVDVSPSNDLTASLFVTFANDDYPNSTYGLTNNSNVTVGPDVAWQVTDSLNTHAYYTYQQIYNSQSSIYESSTTAAINTSPTGTGYSVPWHANTIDSVQTLGLKADWLAIPSVLKLGLDYNLSYGDTAYALGEGVVAVGGGITSASTIAGIQMQSLPDVTSLLSTLNLHGEYTISPKMSLLFGVAWERFIYNDFIIGTSATQYSNVLLPGTPAPNDSVFVVSTALRIKFD